MDLTIKIKEGLGDMRFDMPIEKIHSLMGEASEVENIYNAADEPTTVLHYNNDGITLFFEGEEPTLQCIDVSNEDCTLFDADIFNLSEKEIVKLVVEHKYLEQDVDTEDWGEKRVSFNDANIDFYFNKGELVSVILGK
jgi:hypothetical protein